MLFSWKKKSISTKQLKELMSCANWRGKPAFFQKSQNHYNFTKTGGILEKK